MAGAWNEGSLPVKGPAAVMIMGVVEHALEPIHGGLGWSEFRFADATHGIVITSYECD